MPWPVASTLVTAVAAYVAYVTTRGCGVDGRFCPDACARVDAHLRQHLVGQELALAQLTDAVCDHVANPTPHKPLVVSLHGPPGVGKTYFHKLLAEALYNRTGTADACESGSHGCSGYRIVFGTDYLEAERERQAAALRDSLLGHLHRYPESVLVVEEYDKVDCASRGLLRQLLDKGATSNFSFARSIVVLEANAGAAHMHKLLSSAPSRDALSAEVAQRALKDVLYTQWLRAGCEEPVDTQKTLSLVDLYVPFLPLERRHVRAVLRAHLEERRARGIAAAHFADLAWDDGVLDFLTDRVEFEGQHALEGAREAPVVLSRHVSHALRRRAAAAAGEPPARLRLRLSHAGVLLAEDADERAAALKEEKAAAAREARAAADEQAAAAARGARAAAADADVRHAAHQEL